MISTRLSTVTVLLTCLNVVNIYAILINESCTSGGICLHTWTKAAYDEKRNIAICECQSAFGNDGSYDVSCLGSDLSNGPRVRVEIGLCMTFDEESNLTFMGRCPYNHLDYMQDSATYLPQHAYDLNNFMCDVKHGQDFVCGQQRREGLLCSKCQSGLGPAVASYTHQCVECHWYGTLLYLAYVIIPATVFCVFIILLRINLLSPPTNALVLLCHVMISLANANPCRFIYLARRHHSTGSFLVVMTIYGFLNMDFLSYVLPPFCFSNKISSLHVILLDYIVAIYPLVFTAVIYLLTEVHDRGFRPLRVIWNPIHRLLVHFRRNWNIKGSIINAFTTLYVLSFTKIVSTTVNLMLRAYMTDVCGTKYSTALYYDASCDLFQKCHLPSGILALIIFTCFSLVPTLLLLLYPFIVHSSYCNRWFFHRRFTLLHEIAKIFHQSLKDGSNETRDCRWFAGIYLFLRIVLVGSPLWKTKFQIQVLGSLIGLILVAVFQPHICSSYNYIDAFLFGGIAAIFVLLPARGYGHITQLLLYYIPLILTVILLCWKSNLKAKLVSAVPSLRNIIRICRQKKSEENHVIESGLSQSPRSSESDQLSTSTVTHSVIDIKSYGALE